MLASIAMAATIDLNRVAIAVEVIERGSFTAAAAALGMPKSSVSRGVAALEQELGVTLLKRTTRKLALTPQGQQWFERVRGAIAELEQASACLSDREREPHGLVRITAPPDAGPMLLDALSSFRPLHPDIHVEVLLTARRLDLVEDGVDLALRAGRLEDSSLRARKLFSTDLALYAAPEYLKRRGRPRTISDLAHHDCVPFRAKQGRAKWRLSGPRGQVASVDVTGFISTSDVGLIVDACLVGLGIGLGPMYRCEALARQGRLENVLPGWRLTGSALYLLHADTAFLPRRVEVLRDHLAEQLARPTPSGKRRTTLRR